MDQETGKPTPTAFDLRFPDKDESYLSVNWLELLHPTAAELPQKIDTLRQWLTGRPAEEKVMRPTKNGAFAAIHVEKIHTAKLCEEATGLVCTHEPVLTEEPDPHSGVWPQPGVETWPKEDDAPGKLAMSLFFFESMSHWERGILPPEPSAEPA